MLLFCGLPAQKLITWSNIKANCARYVDRVLKFDLFDGGGDGQHTSIGSVEKPKIPEVGEMC